MDLIAELTEMIAKQGTGELVRKAGLDPDTAAKAVPTGVEVILGQLGVGQGGAGGLLERGMGALGGLLGGGTPSLPDHEGAASQLASKLGLGKEKAGGILSVLLPLVLQALQEKGGSGGSVLGGLGKLFG